jgi:predicted O-methyltransferase YrrM
MKTLAYIMKKFNLNEKTVFPVKLVFKRYDMAGMFSELGFTRGAEIGVDMGHFTEILCMQNPTAKIYAIDSWEGKYESHYENAKKRLAPYNCTLIKATSMEAVKQFKEGDLDFVYIDANHDYDHVKEDLEAWSKIVRKDGIVSGHDYGHYKYKDKYLGSKRAIDEYVDKHNRELFLVNRNYQTTWFFVQ